MTMLLFFFWAYLYIFITMEPGSSGGVSCCGFFTIFDSWCDEEQHDSCSLKRMWWMETVCTTKSGEVRHLKDLYYARAIKEEEGQEASLCFYKLFSGFNLLSMANTNITKKKKPKKHSSVLHIWIKPADCFRFLKLTKISGDVVNDAKKKCNWKFFWLSAPFSLNQYVRLELLGNCVVHNLISSKSF